MEPDMADEETEEQIEDTEGTEPKSGGKKKLIVIASVIVVLGVGGFFAAGPIMNMISPADEVVADEAEQVSQDPALFAPLLPPLIVNIRDSIGNPHFMQITLEIMAREQSVIDEVKNHAAVIRNELILMYGSSDFDVVQTRDGKEQMLADALAEIQSIVEAETGEVGVEAVYFTSLIIQ
jgi:flagellar FliL protein